MDQGGNLRELIDEEESLSDETGDSEPDEENATEEEPAPTQPTKTATKLTAARK